MLYDIICTSTVRSILTFFVFCNFFRCSQQCGTHTLHQNIWVLLTFSRSWTGYLSPSAGLKFADVPNGLAAISKARPHLLRFERVSGQLGFGGPIRCHQVDGLRSCSTWVGAKSLVVQVGTGWTWKWKSCSVSQKCSKRASFKGSCAIHDL